MTELASILGVSRETVGRWQKIPGNPGRRSDGRMEVDAWRRWAETNRNRYLGPTGRELKNRLLEAQIATVEHRLKVSQRMHVSIELVDAIANRLSTVIRREVRKIHRLAHELENRTAPDVEAILRNEEHDLLERLQKGAEGIR